ncbi:glycosyltransferase family 4 protein [Ruminococcus albus]|uniref:Galacturonosyltransferase n=1 Tax=Ruminococcus albus TaxID=1264 RepID=A0A1H7KQ74_RUMAL|nr:glycosyltransferase family 4 protein [Ruminococcus albus]SEK89013.1 galacturonosyltransferase [Ruminococcus albus]
MRERILIVSNVTAGLVSFRSELIETLKKKYNVIVLASDNGRKERLEALGVKVINIDLERHGTNPLKEIKIISLYKSYMKRIKPIIVLTYTIKPNIYAGMAAACLNIPYVANITGLGSTVENSGLMQKITIPLYRFGLRKAQKVFFQNSYNQKFMLQRHIVEKKQCELLPGSGVNLEKYNVHSYPNKDTIDFVFISRVIKEKGIDQYLDAAKYIRKKYPQTRFHICGDCEEEYEELLKQLEHDGVIIYHGRIEDISEMHRQCSCTIHPSYYPEGMSNVLLEACACGRPIITTNRPGCQEVVEDGINGFIVKQKDSKDLICKIEMFLNLSNEAKMQMGLAGRRKVEQEFDRKIVINKYLQEISKREVDDGI